jgi:glucose/arabinose dehydrogenase
MRNVAAAVGVVAIGVAGNAVFAQGEAAPSQPADPMAAPEIERFTVRAGYKVEAVTPRLDNVRFMEFAPDGALYISRPRFGDVVTLRDLDKDGVYENLSVYVEGLEGPHALCWHNDALWIAAQGLILRTVDADRSGMADEVIERVSGLPRDGGHWWRSLLVTDAHIYTSIGDSGNITDEQATDRQKIWRFNHEGGEKTLFATGIRNTEELRLRPGTSEIWGVDHGSDNFGELLGEDAERMPYTDWNPPDELNRYEEGKFYGHPFVTGNMVPRYEFREREDVIELGMKTVPPAWRFGAHWAANCFAFVDPVINERTKALPAACSGDAFVACRGSWNRSARAGYQVARVIFDKDPVLGGGPCGLETIVSTLAKSESGEDVVLARPVDCAQGPDGMIYFTSDLPTGRVYRIRWIGDAKPD